MKKIILVNLLVTLFLFGILEFASYLYLRHDAGKYLEDIKRMAKETNTPMPTQRYARVQIFNQENIENYMREVNKCSNCTTKKRSIIFFGCSYTYGTTLDNKETFPAIITQKTGRTTINRGIQGGSITNTLYDLKHENLYKRIEDIPEYIVYIYINDHLNRISNPYKNSFTSSHNPLYELNISYEKKNNELIEKKPNQLLLPFYTLFTVKAWHYLYAENFSVIDKNEKLEMYFVEAKRITDEKFPNSKFIIIDWQDGGHVRMLPPVKENLEKDGFIVFDAEDLAGHELNSEKYRAIDKEHPSAAAFEDVAKGLIEKLNL